MNKQANNENISILIRNHVVSGRGFVNFVEFGVPKSGRKLDLTLLEFLNTIGDNSGGCPYLANLSKRF